MRCHTDSPFEVCCQRIQPVSQCSVMVGDRPTRFKTRKPLAHRRNDDSLVLDDGRSGEWTLHELRRAAAMMMQALRVSPDVIARCPNHVSPGSKVRRHCLHHDHAVERRDAWRLPGKRLEAIMTADDVLSLRRAA